MDASIFRIPVMSWLFRQAKAIPIASARSEPELLDKAFARVSEELRDGQLVCIFPEGKITANGDMSPFRPGVTRILANDPVPVVPIALQGLWGSFFSRRDGTAMSRPFRRGLFNRIGIAVGEPIDAVDAAPEVLFARVSALRGDWR
jgi:1-acyl-sn-glycerol-3-phosphate acyltransferase